MREFAPRLATFTRNRWIMRSLFAATGALAGYAYYFFIGCNSGTCPISSNPYVSTMYGAVMAILLSPTKKENVQEKGTSV